MTHSPAPGAAQLGDLSESRGSTSQSKLRGPDRVSHPTPDERASVVLKLRRALSKMSKGDTVTAAGWVGEVINRIEGWE